MDQARRAGIHDDELLRVELVLEELTVNIFTHAYSGHKGNVEVDCRVEKCLEDSAMFCMRVRDWSPAFNPLEGNIRELPEDISIRSVGGVGLHIVRTMADCSSYSRTDACNEVKSCFRLPV